MTNFKRKVIVVVKKIKRGSVMTYKDVAHASGSPFAYRAVARIMSTNHDSGVPCHRVIRSDGTLGGYNGGGINEKYKKLLKEGYKF